MNLLELLRVPKRCDAQRPRIQTKPGHRSLDLAIVCQATKAKMHVYLRQNAHLFEDYSCGLVVDGISMFRVNGFSHNHPNPDGVQLGKVPHVHFDLEDWDQPLTRPPKWAFPVSAPYTMLPGAFELLVVATNLTLTTPEGVRTAVRKCHDPTSGQLTIPIVP